MAYCKIVKKLPKNVIASPRRVGLYLSDKYIYEEGVSSYIGEKVFYRYKRSFEGSGFWHSSVESKC